MRPARFPGFPFLALSFFVTVVVSSHARAATVSGFVHSAADGEALGYANVFLPGTPFGDMANQLGYYVITDLPAGTYQIAFTYVGYRQETRSLTLSAEDAVTLTVELQPTAVAMPEIQVQGTQDEHDQPGTLTLQTPQLLSIPSVVEADLFRAVQSLPGVSSLSDFSSGLYVRGGSADQNLILLDDIDVYNPSHLFGFFSTFNVDAVKTVDLQKSGYPARYGGRLSSLLDVRNRDGNRKRLQGSARVSVIGAEATVDGPWRHGSWMLSGRRTYIEALARAAGIDLPYYFYDFHARVNADLDPSNKTSVSVFTGRDRLNWDKESLDVLLDWGNDTVSLQWTHLFNPRLFSHFVLGGSRFDSQGKIAFQDFAFRMRNRIEDVALKGSLSYTPNARHLVDFGFESKSLDFLFRRSAGEADQLEFAYQGIYGALYAQDRWDVSDDWQLQTGLRLDYYSEGSYFDVGPRLTVRRRVNDALSLHATYGRYYQYLNLVSEEGASFADMWFPVDETLSPGHSDQYLLGATLRPAGSFDVTAEIYYKSYGNLVEFDEEFGNSIIDDDAQLGEAFLSGDGRAFGGDLFLRNHIRGFDGWFGYTWGDTRRTIPGFNYGREFYPAYDRRHQIVAMQRLEIGRGWMMDLNFRYGSGQPTTLGTGRYTVHDITGREYDLVRPGRLNDQRLPEYHRLDIGFSRRFEKGRWTIEPTIQLVNVYNHRNVYIRYYDTTKNPVATEDVTMLPFLPTAGVHVSF